MVGLILATGRDDLLNIIIDPRKPEVVELIGIERMTS